MVQFHWATRTTVFWYWSWKIIFVFCLLGKHAPLCSALTQANYLQATWGMWHVTTWGMLGENVRHTHAAPIWTSLTICTCTGLVHCGHYVAGGKEQTRAHFSWAGFGVFLGGRCLSLPPAWIHIGWSPQHGWTHRQVEPPSAKSLGYYCRMLGGSEKVTKAALMCEVTL